MMIHLIDNDTKETFKSFGDNEVQAAIAAARASGKIVTMDLDENNEHCQIFITRDKKADQPVILTTEAWNAIAEISDSMIETAHEIAEAIQKAADLMEPIVLKFGEAFLELKTTRPPSEIKKEIKHTKNPMRLSQLYKELNASYKKYGRKKKNV